jgi:nucleotide-binding universal stress UspA family protein
MKRILVGIDGSSESRAAAGFAARLAKATGAGLILAGIAFESDPLVDPEMRARMQIYEQQEIARMTTMIKGIAEEMARPDLAIETLVETGGPAVALAEIASRKDVDMVVVGHRGRSAVKRLLLGSVADRLVQICTKPVTVVR